MPCTTLHEVYKLIRERGSRGQYTPKWMLVIHRRATGIIAKPDIVCQALTNAFIDIAEEDDGQIFSAEDWELIKKSVDTIE